MPRSLKPDDLKTGSGKRVPEKGTTVVLSGTGMVGAGPNIGQAGWMSLGGEKALPTWLKNKLNSAGGTALAHMNQATGAHTAAAISAIGIIDGLDVNNVQEGILDLHGALPIEPPHLGEWRTNSILSGITDWGQLKVEDRDLVTRGVVTGLGTIAADQMYPYFYKAPSPLIAGPTLTVTPYNAHGGDPQTDNEWNSGLVHGTEMYGTGTGMFRAGAFTRDGSGINQEVMRTTHIGIRPTDLDDVTALPLRVEATISGALYPADRGVLALIHWPPGTVGVAPTVTDFLAQDLDDRCVAALLLGQGVYGENCDADCVDQVCDGDAGGIFGVGEDDNGDYDPFVFPGRATGQYDLSEIHAGTNRLDSSNLQEPFTNGGLPSVRAVNGTVPAPGQVRLGTDPSAGAADPTTYGIPILGSNMEAYDAGTPPAAVSNVDAPRIGHLVIGNSIVQMEDPGAPGVRLTGTNFFRYRLPYLKSYTGTAGLKWTPAGDTFTTSRETFRFFDKASPSDTAGTLPTAGNYGTPFTEDQISWQLARYRHSFLLPSTTAAGVEEEIGTYWLVHFKTERNFEAFVQDGTMPWDASDGYEVYGAETFTTTDHSEADGNIVNEQLSTAGFRAPWGFAPDYGYVAQPNFQRRQTLFLEGTLGAPAYTGTFAWSVTNPTTSIVWVSGVAHFTPRRVSNGALNFEITDVTVTESTTTFFNRAFRTDDSWITGEATDPLPAAVDPALISSPSPAFITFFPFAYGPHPSPPTDQLAGPSATFTLAADTANGLSDFHSPQLPSRVEIPYTHMGPGGGTQYSDTNGPQSGDGVLIGTGAGADIPLLGDDTLPSFMMRARPRAFFRRPTLHALATTAVEPYSAAAGHGVILQPVGSAEILLHTTRFDVANLVGEFGNFNDGLGPPSGSYAPLFTAAKDVRERFLDETYRYSMTWAVDAGDPGDIDNVYAGSPRGQLIGPGMAAWTGGAIEVPVRAGLNTLVDWGSASWLPMSLDLVDFNDHGGAGYTLMGGELQVTGWPDRNPPLTDRVDAPYPSTGLLVYPRRDFSTVGSPNIRPNGPLGSADLAVEQPDYSALVGTREFTRAFDASFNGTVAAAGQPFVTVRIDGVTLADIAYTAPGPGSLNRADANANTFCAIMVKIPGLTSWMDIGRADGAGPSKQDALLDGAGCQVVGPDTLSGIDTASGIVYAQVRCNVGPIANLFASTGIGGSRVGEVPVLVKVVMLVTGLAMDMATEFDGVDFNAVVGSADVGETYGELRGICGIRLIAPA
jgi:hypothetical protein